MEALNRNGSGGIVLAGTVAASIVVAFLLLSLLGAGMMTGGDCW